MTLKCGVGLPGRVWDRAEPDWIPELAADSNFLRRSAALADGFQSAFAVPILLRDQCLGVLEFFSLVSRPADPGILEMMGSLGTQIGQFIDRHQMRTRVVQSEKLASLGMLSAGVAHEINNPLAYIATNLAVLERDSRFLLTLLTMYESGDDSLAAAQPELHRQIERFATEFDLAYVRENMGKISGEHEARSEASGRYRAKPSRLHASRSGRGQPKLISTRRLGLRLRCCAGGWIGAGSRSRNARGELPLVAGSPAQLNQVFLNLLVNAMQAIETVNREDGRITITTEEKAGEIWVEVTDNGCGIPEENLPRIFTPFFTTKEVGDGTGLGLSITHGIIQDHGGRLQVESGAGSGTTFSSHPSDRAELRDTSGKTLRSDVESAAERHEDRLHAGAWDRGFSIRGRTGSPPWISWINDSLPAEVQETEMSFSNDSVGRDSRERDLAGSSPLLRRDLGLCDLLPGHRGAARKAEGAGGAGFNSVPSSFHSSPGLDSVPGIPGTRCARRRLAQHGGLRSPFRDQARHAAGRHGDSSRGYISRDLLNNDANQGRRCH